MQTRQRRHSCWVRGYLLQRSEYGAPFVPFMSRFQRIGTFWKAVINVSLLKDSDTDSCDRLLPLLL